MYATFHLLIMNESKYIDGACISVSTFKEYGNKNIKHICLVDDSISKDGIKKLKKYFDQVEKIDLIQINSNFKINSNKKKERYGKWIDVAATKWSILYFEQFDKVLLCDVDTLAVSDYTKIFDIKTPAWCFFHKNALDIKRLSKIISTKKSGSYITDKFIKDYTGFTQDEICSKQHKMRFIPVNGSMVLLKPSKKIFKEMFEYAKSKKFESVSLKSFPDENLLFDFYYCHLKKRVYCIGPEYLVTEWRLKEPAFSKIDHPIIFNYDSTEKPWIKNNKNLYEEEKIWKKLREKYNV